MAQINIVCNLEPTSPRPLPLPPVRIMRLEPISSSDSSDDSDGHLNGEFAAVDTPTTTYSTDKSKGGSLNGAGHINIPDGGRRAWLVVLGGFLNFTIGFGTIILDMP